MGLGKRIPGERSNITLLLASTWAATGLFILIIGHLAIVFYIYGLMTNTDTLADLENFMPMLTQTYLYIIAGLAILLDIWIIISHKKQREHKIQR